MCVCLCVHAGVHIGSENDRLDHVCVCVRERVSTSIDPSIGVCVAPRAPAGLTVITAVAV